MTDSLQSMGHDDFPTSAEDKRAVAEITATLSGTLPANAIRYLIDETNPRTMPEQHGILSRLTTHDVEQFLPDAGIPHLQTFLRFEVAKLLQAHPDIQTIEGRYEFCSNEMSGNKNPLLPFVKDHITKIKLQ